MSFPDFLLIWLTSCFPQLPQAAMMLTIASNWYQKVISGKTLFTLGKLFVKLDKNRIAMGSPSELPYWPNNDSSRGMCLWISSNPVLAPPVSARLQVYIMTVGCWFSRHHGFGEWGMKIGQVRVSQRYCSYQDSAIF